MENLSATAYLQTQKNLIEDLEFAYGEYKTYQVPLSKIIDDWFPHFEDLRLIHPLINWKRQGDMSLKRPRILKFKI